MWNKMKQKVIPAALLLVAAGTFSVQAHAMDDHETAILVGVAVGGLAAISAKHHLDHDSWDRNRREVRHYHHHGKSHDYYRPQRVEHHVIHYPPQRREYEHEYRRAGYDGGHGRDNGRGHGKRRGGGYEYEYEYKRRTSF